MSSATAIRYRPGRVAFTGMLFGVLAAAAGYLALGNGGVIASVAALGLGYMAFVHGRCALGDRPAIAFSSERLTINGVHSSTRVPWSEVRDIRVQTLTMNVLYVIPVSRHDFLVVQVSGGASGTTTFKLSARQLELPPGGMQALHGSLCSIWQKSAAPSAQASTDQPSAATGAEFDPDAAIQRYLANRQASQQVTPAGPSSPPAASVPPRPVFGRRGL